MEFCFKNCNFTNLLYCLDTIGVITIYVHLNRTKKIIVSFWSKFRRSGWKVWKTVLYRIGSLILNFFILNREILTKMIWDTISGRKKLWKCVFRFSRRLCFADCSASRPGGAASPGSPRLPSASRTSLTSPKSKSKLVRNWIRSLFRWNLHQSVRFDFEATVTKL